MQAAMGSQRAGSELRVCAPAVFCRLSASGLIQHSLPTSYPSLESASRHGLRVGALRGARWLLRITAASQRRGSALRSPSSASSADPCVQLSFVSDQGL